VKTYTTKTYGKGEDMKSKTEGTESIKDLVRIDTPESQVASVTCGFTRKVSDAAYWGDGTWDKIPWSVEAFSSVTLKCEQTESSLDAARERALNIAWEASQENIGHAIVSHVDDIKTRLFPHLF